MKSNFARNLQILRKKKSFTQEELAKKVDLTKGAISQYEMGTSEVSIAVLIKLAAVLEVSLDHLVLGDAGDKLTQVSKSEEAKNDKLVRILSDTVDGLNKRIAQLETGPSKQCLPAEKHKE